MVPVCPITSPFRPRRPFTRTKVPCERERAIPKRCASTGGQVFRGEEGRGSDGEQHTGRAVAAEGRSERYRGPSDHRMRRFERYRPTFVDEIQSATSSQQTLVVFMTGEGMEEMNVEPVTTAVSYP